MSRSGKEGAQINKLEAYLGTLKLLDSRNLFPGTGFAISEVRGLPYVALWQKHVKSLWYDIRLDDNSLLFFHHEGNIMNFSYLGCPYDGMPYSEYEAKAKAAGVDDSLIDLGYEDYLGTTDLRDNPSYFRYDYDESSYRSALHPVAHLHCGLVSSVRIGIYKKLDVMSFTAFILRQIYTDKWETVLKAPDDYHELYEHKVRLSAINERFYQSKDQNQDFYLI